MIKGCKHVVLTEDEKHDVRLIGTERYLSKRKVGITDVRPDGSRTEAENDVQGAGAEYYAARCFGQQFNDSITRHGDGGTDFELRLHDGVKKVDVKWLGFRRTGRLIVNPDKPHLWADLYISVGGTLEEGYHLNGWITHAELAALPKQDLGYGFKFAVHIDRLHTEELV